MGGSSKITSTRERLAFSWLLLYRVNRQCEWVRDCATSTSCGNSPMCTRHYEPGHAPRTSQLARLIKCTTVLEPGHTPHISQLARLIKFTTILEPGHTPHISQLARLIKFTTVLEPGHTPHISQLARLIKCTTVLEPGHTPHISQLARLIKFTTVLEPGHTPHISQLARLIKCTTVLEPGHTPHISRWLLYFWPVTFFFFFPSHHMPVPRIHWRRDGDATGLGHQHLYTLAMRRKAAKNPVAP